MSIAEYSLAEMALAAQPDVSTSAKKTPVKRKAIAISDTVLQPEAR